MRVTCTSLHSLPPSTQSLHPDFLSRGFVPPTFATASLIADVWSNAFDAELQEASDSSTLARLRSVSAPAAGACLQAIPSTARTAFGNAEFLSAIRLRLGLEDPAWSGLTCLCDADAPSVAHVLRVGLVVLAALLSMALRDTMAAIAAQAHYQVRAEAVGHLPSRPGGTADRRPDVALFDRSTGS